MNAVLRRGMRGRSPAFRRKFRGGFSRLNLDKIESMTNPKTLFSDGLLQDVRSLIAGARRDVARTVNAALVALYPIRTAPNWVHEATPREITCTAHPALSAAIR